MSSAPYTFWAIVLIFSTIGIYGKDGDKDEWKHMSTPVKKGIIEEIRFSEYTFV